MEQRFQAITAGNETVEAFYLGRVGISVVGPCLSGATRFHPIQQTRRRPQFKAFQITAQQDSAEPCRVCREHSNLSAATRACGMIPQLGLRPGPLWRFKRATLGILRRRPGD
ncbi:MAG TPA: hypothetical protein DCE55_10840 [Planctomycetaceae bacterium]|nr:hypothetical protein [Planctomycetaceae bacterium]